MLTVRRDRRDQFCRKCETKLRWFRGVTRLKVIVVGGGGAAKAMVKSHATGPGLL